MCIDVRKTCECKRHTVQFHLRDNVLVPRVIARLYCPSCPGDSGYDPVAMLCDNGWVQLDAMGEDGTVTHHYNGNLEWMETTA